MEDLVSGTAGKVLLEDPEDPGGPYIFGKTSKGRRTLVDLEDPGAKVLRRTLDDLGGPKAY